MMPESVDLIMGAIVLICILFDLLSGFVKGAYLNELSSTKMREGLFHKLGFILAVILAFGAQALCVWFELPEVFVTIYPAACLWIVFTELVSIIENLCVFSPELANSPLAKLLESAEKEQNK